MTDPLPDPIPLGVAGIVTIPRSAFLAAMDPSRPVRPLLDDVARLALLAETLREALTRPVAGLRQLARIVLDTEDPDELCRGFAEKVLETLRDGNRHDRTIITTSTERFALMFITWNGTHREVQPERYGRYLPSLLSMVSRIAEMADSIGGFLEINAFVRDEPDVAHPTVPPGNTLEIDVEYSYIPGGLIAGVKSAGAPQNIVLNGDLMSPEQRRNLTW